MPRRIVRASEYWNEDTPRAPRIAGSDWQALAQGPSIQPGLLHFGAATAPDPSKAPGQDDADKEDEASALEGIRKMPGLTDINRALSGGGAHGDGTPENWPSVLPGDQLLGEADRAIGGIIDKLPGLLGKGK